MFQERAKPCVGARAASEGFFGSEVRTTGTSKGLKIPRAKALAGSSPAPGTGLFPLAARAPHPPGHPSRGRSLLEGWSQGGARYAAGLVGSWSGSRCEGAHELALRGSQMSGSSLAGRTSNTRIWLSSTEVSSPLRTCSSTSQSVPQNTRSSTGCPVGKKEMTSGSK